MMQTIMKLIVSNKELQSLYVYQNDETPKLQNNKNVAQSPMQSKKVIIY